MKRKLSLYLLLLHVLAVQAQQKEVKFSAVNPALFLYTTEDVYVNPPIKFNNGTNIIKPDTTNCPWEKRLENGMPNVIKDADGNLSIYISSFISFAAKPPSKVGALVYTNNTNDITAWTRPDAGLYWYNAAGTTADEKISSTYQSGYKSTNIVAVDIESLGMYDDHETTEKPIKLIYLPQRESHNQIISAYEMDKTFVANGILQGFYSMKDDRTTKQKNFTFDFINGDTHMNFLKQNGDYYFVSRLNAKRSALQSGETLPLRPDRRKRYRRETVTHVGAELTSQKVELNIALDMSDLSWEPYSMQPFRLPGFEDDIWWGLVTMFGTEGNEEVQHKQRTELAISNNGKDWKYLKPGVPFLDNGTNPNSDDYGCINIAKPVIETNFSNDPMTALYFYAASNIRHISGRNPGISLATGNYGKIAGLKVENTPKSFYSMIPSDNSTVTVDDMPKFSMGNAFRLGSEPNPYILADVTEDPRGMTIGTLDSYAAVVMYAYSENEGHGRGAFLGGSLGSPIEGSSTISDDYEFVPFISGGISSKTKQHLLNYLKGYSEQHPTEIVSIKDFPEIPIVMEALLKNATLYGLKFNVGNGVSNAGSNFAAPSLYEDTGLWSYTPPIPSAPCHTEDFTSMMALPNQKSPLNKETGSFALSVTPGALSANRQTIMRLYGNNSNDIGIYYGSDGAFEYTLQKDGLPFATMSIAPPTGYTFENKKVTLTVEAVKSADRKHGSDYTEESAIFRVACPDLDFEQVLQQDILWNWKHAEGSITAADSANARAFAYLASTAFVAGMDTISIGGRNSNCDEAFLGDIHHVEIADHLPVTNSDFWNEPTETRGLDEPQQREEAIQENFLSVYPSPLRRGEPMQLLIGATQAQTAQLRLTDLAGRTVAMREMNISAGENRTAWYLPQLGAGHYVLTYTSESMRIARKIIVVE